MLEYKFPTTTAAADSAMTAYETHVGIDSTAASQSRSSAHHRSGAGTATAPLSPLRVGPRTYPPSTLRTSAGHDLGSTHGLRDTTSTTASTALSVKPSAPLSSKPQRSPHHLPQLMLPDAARCSPPTAGSPSTTREIDGSAGSAGSAYSTAAEKRERVTPTLPSHTRRLSPLSPLALPSSAPAPARTLATGSTVEVTEMAEMATVPRRSRIFSDAGPLKRTASGHVILVPRASSAKVGSVFEQRRIPLPPPAMPGCGGGVVDNTPLVPPSRQQLETTTPAPVPMEDEEQSPPPQPLRATRAVPLPSALKWVVDKERGSGAATQKASRAPAKTSPSPRSTVFAAVAFDATPREEASSAAAAASPVKAPTSLVQTRLPPTAPPLAPFKAPAPSKVTNVADAEQAQMVRDLLQWRRCGRHRQLLMRGGSGDDLRYDVQPVTVQSSRPPRALGSVNDADDDRTNAEAATAPPAPPLDAETSLSAVEILPTASQLSPEAASRRVRVSTSRSHHELAEDAARRQEASQPLRTVSSRSHMSILSRSSTPDAAGSAEGSGAHFRKLECSPKHGAALRRSLPSDRLFARPSSTSLNAEGHREGSGWSRSEAGPWGGSSRHLNMSTLTISCAPALGSFSTNSESSLFP